MDKNLTPNEQQLSQELSRLIQTGLVPHKYQIILQDFFEQIQGALRRAQRPLDDFYAMFHQFLFLLEKQLQNPFIFEPYHQRVTKPFDYHRFAINFIRPLIDIEHSKIFGLENATQIEEKLRHQENVILLANHQTEPDPQAISILLERTHPQLAEKIIYVAGERVVTDPLAVPFSMGYDLLCIYSKRYIDRPLELKAKKQLHNQRTMEQMRELLSEGGKVIYVAPAGGRDRRNSNGIVEVASFDPQSIEMFHLMAKKSKRTTHFYPLTLATYELFPPPKTIQRELGESRTAQFTPISISFSSEFNMEFFPGSDESDKIQRRKNRAVAIWNIVNQEHQRLIHL